MKKLILLTSFIFILAASVGCTQRTTDYSDNERNQNGTVTDNNGMDTGMLETTPDYATDTKNQVDPTRLNTNNGTVNDQPSGMGATDNNFEKGTYQTRLKDVDTRLRTSIKDMNNIKIDQTDKDYITKRRDYLKTSADAYNTALTEIRDIDYSPENSAYHNAIVNYYQAGYNRYTDLHNAYGDFTTYDDESMYLGGLDYDPYVFDNDIQSYYDDALDFFKIRPIASNY